MKSVYKKYKDRQEGSAMLITTIIITALLVIVVTTISMSGRQVDLAALNRNTSNTYYLTKSAAQKEAEVMNEVMQTSLQNLVADMNPKGSPSPLSSATPAPIPSNDFISQLIDAGKNDSSPYKDAIVYDDSGSRGVIKVKDDVIRAYIVSRVKEDICAEYGITPISATPAPISGTTTATPKPVYTVKGDRAEDGYETEIKIEVEEIALTSTDTSAGKFKITSTGTTTKSGSTNIYDEQIVEAIVEINIPNTILNEIHERYEFDVDGGKDVVPEILNNAITCYSDIIVGGASEQTLTVTGDVYVGGKPNISSYTLSGVAGIHYPEHDQNGGVVVKTGGLLDVTGNVFTTRNILATGGWGNGYSNPGKIKISEDAMAYTIGIVDDFYKGSYNQNPFNSSNQVNGANILVQGNAMVDNDVMIDRWVSSSKVELPNGNIYGVNAGADSTGSTSGNIDPNQSSGVFCQGPSSIIEADKMFVVGQPYITLEEGRTPLKLWESIGEPFDGIASFEGYATNVEQDTNKEYLLPTSPFYNMIQKDKIKTDFDETYAIAKVSGVDTSAGSPGVQKVGEDCQAIFGTSQLEAVQFFSQGGSSHNFGVTVDGRTDYVSAVEAIIADINGPCNSYAGKLSGTTKIIGGTPPLHNYKGIRGYMTAKRAILYDKFTTAGAPTTVKFDEMMNNKLSTISPNTWTYKTPIMVIDSSSSSREVDISNLYVDEDGTWVNKPTIIVNKTMDELTIKYSNSSRSEFKGVIISKGPVKIEGGTSNPIKIFGSIIVGGNQREFDYSAGEDRKLIFSGENRALTIEGQVLVEADPDIIFDVVAHNKDLYRSILDMLGITHYEQYKDETSKQIFNITNMDNSTGSNHQFGKKIVNYTDESIIEVNTEGMEVVITGLKKRK